MVGNLLYRNGAEFFYSNRANKNLRLEGNYLPVTTSAIGWDRVEAVDNEFFVPNSTAAAVRVEMSAGAAVKSSVFENNTFLAGTEQQNVVTVTEGEPKQTKNYTFAKWQADLGFDAKGKLIVVPGQRPAAVRVFVRRNHYEPSRGHVVIYNWPKQDAVEVDIGAMNPQPGDRWELRNVQNYFEEKISGVYDGKPLRVPMTGWTVASPIGETDPLNPVTFPEFGVFVLTLERAKRVSTFNGAQPEKEETAPGAIVMTRWEGLTSDPQAAAGPEYGPELGGVMVQLRDCEGREWMAPMLAVGPAGATYAIPGEFAIGPVAATVLRGAERLDGGDFFLRPTAPSLFSADGTGRGPAAGYATQEGVGWQPLADCATPPCQAVPVQGGATAVVTLFGTAFGTRPAEAKISALVAEAKAEVLGIEADGMYPGLDLIRLKMPAGLAGRGAVPVQIAVDQTISNAVTVAVQ